MIPVAGILVLFLYVLLFHEITAYFWSDKRQKRKQESNNATYQRPKHSTQEHGGNHNFNILWKRMKQATEAGQLNGIDHKVITQVMADARVQRLKEQQRISAAKIDSSVD